MVAFAYVCTRLDARVLHTWQIGTFVEENTMNEHLERCGAGRGDAQGVRRRAGAAAGWVISQRKRRPTEGTVSFAACWCALVR